MTLGLRNKLQVSNKFREKYKFELNILCVQEDTKRLISLIGKHILYFHKFNNTCCFWRKHGWKCRSRAAITGSPSQHRAAVPSQGIPSRFRAAEQHRAPARSSQLLLCAALTPCLPEALLICILPRQLSGSTTLHICELIQSHSTKMLC